MFPSPVGVLLLLIVKEKATNYKSKFPSPVGVLLLLILTNKLRRNNFSEGFRPLSGSYYS